MTTTPPPAAGGLPRNDGSSVFPRGARLGSLPPQRYYYQQQQQQQPSPPRACVSPTPQWMGVQSLDRLPLTEAAIRSTASSLTWQPLRVLAKQQPPQEWQYQQQPAQQQQQQQWQWQRHHHDHDHAPRPNPMMQQQPQLIHQWTEATWTATWAVFLATLNL